MELILWRHAEAEDGVRDLERSLTAKGRKQAAHMAAWLRDRLPSEVVVFSSPAVRARQTAEALGIEIKIAKKLAPGAGVSAILAVAGWPDIEGGVVVVGHQPDLGRVVGYLLSGREIEVSVRKGAVWWFASASGGDAAKVRAVMSPDLL